MRPICRLFCISIFLMTGCYASSTRIPMADAGPWGCTDGDDDCVTIGIPDYAEVVISLSPHSMTTRIESLSFPVITGIMDLYALNAGLETGTLDRITLETRVVRIDAAGVETPASIHHVTDRCRMYRSGDPDPMYAEGRFEDDRIVFERVGIPVTPEDDGSDFSHYAHIVTLCDINPDESELGHGETLRVWYSMESESGATLFEPPPSTVHGTPALDRNTDPVSGTHYVDVVRR